MSQVTVKKIVEGDFHMIIRVDFNSDGSGELVDQVILSPSDLIPVRSNNEPTFRIMQLWYGLIWFDVAIGYGGITPEYVWTIARDADSHVDFRSFGGLKDVTTSPPSDTTGQLVITTNGFAPVGSRGNIIMELKKVH